MKILLLLLFAISAGLSRAADPSPHEKKKPVVEKRWSSFKHIDGVFKKAEYIHLNTNSTERLYFRYGPISDSGVELERTINNAVLWRVHVMPLGDVAHSIYRHNVQVRIEGEKIIVISTGDRRIFEVRDLKTGDLLTRKVSDGR